MNPVTIMYSGGNVSREEMEANQARVANITSTYTQNPLNSMPAQSMGAGNTIYNSNSFAFSNQISAQGVTPEQVDRQLNDEFGRQVATAGNMIDDGVSY
ncbi:hypothetical protein KKJFFJLC_00062 [Vibrio phage vB_VpaS_PGB]|nr:hypothetical protein KKJFFJLC_00062 [Vibrio phage vB_VpaS_PGB]